MGLPERYCWSLDRLMKLIRQADAKEGEFPYLCVNIAGHLHPESHHSRLGNALVMPFGSENSFTFEYETLNERGWAFCVVTCRR